LADGRDCSHICYIAVHPADQGRGLGKEIVARPVRLSASHRKIILYAVPGTEALYGRFGFRRVTTAMAIFEAQAQGICARLSAPHLTARGSRFQQAFCVA
jgi:ribosomal protein S18 acetylase RimI-like enzyme